MQLLESGADARALKNNAKKYLFQNTAFGTKILPKILQTTAGKKVEPIYVQLVDNSPYAGRYTDRHKAMKFLEEFGIKLAKDGIFANVLPNMLSLDDYESQYMSKKEFQKRGYQGVASANLMGLSSKAILDEFVFTHPVFGESCLYEYVKDVCLHTGCFIQKLLKTNS